MRAKKAALAIVIALALFLTACKARPKTVEIKPFIGGTEGVALEFAADQRNRVFDSGVDPFDVVVKLENRGEHFVPKGKAKVSITGILPQSFGKTEEQLTQVVNDDLIEKRLDPSGNVIPSPPLFVEFKGLNYLSPIVGAELTLPLRASVCFSYKTNAVSKLCVRENILSPAPDGICKIEEQKQIAVSGSPLHITRFLESARGSDKIGFTLEVKHVGKGIPFEPDSRCDSSRAKDNVFVKVDTRMEGLSCTGLPEKSGTAVQGKVKLIDGLKTITCTQVVKPADYEVPVFIEIAYDYEESKTMSLTVAQTVKESAGGEGNQT